MKCRLVTLSILAAAAIALLPPGFAQQTTGSIGRNPFVQSTLYGEGYDWAQQYSVSSGDIVGALPVGMETRGSSDAPYWPSQNCYVYKEVWVHAAGRWFWLMRDLAGPALVDGRVSAGAAAKVEFAESATGRVLAVDADPARGSFRAFVPGGIYTVRAACEQVSLTALPGGTYHLDLRGGHALDFSVAAEKAAGGAVAIRVTASGKGVHWWTVRAENLAIDGARRELALSPGKPGAFVWKARALAPDRPWLAVVILDGDVSQRKEVVGSNL